MSDDKKLARSLVELGGSLERHHKAIREHLIRKATEPFDPENVWCAAVGGVLTDVFICMYGSLRVSDGRITLRQLVEESLLVAQKECERQETVMAGRAS